MSQICALVLDDDENSLGVISRMLSDLETDCVTLQDPTQVEEVLQSLECLDVVFLDLGMPKLNGYELLPGLREFVGPIPIIACTVHTSELNTARKMGFDGFIAKPLSAERFPDQLERILNGKGVWEAY